MNKTAIKNFAIWARNKLVADVRYRAKLVGITENGVQNPLPQSEGPTEFYDIGTATPYAISGREITQRWNLARELRHRPPGGDFATLYRSIMDEVAYTWFNRLIAVRFMEVNDYLPVRVLSSVSGKIEPDLVTHPFDAGLSFTAEEEQTIIRLKQDNKLDELFRLLFIKQCNALAAVLPALFEQTEDYTELLLNLSVVDQDGVVWRLIHDIPEDDFNVEKGGQVEIIGWLYQYYNTEPKVQVFARPSGQKIRKEDIPAATQLFTPDWIVRYMVENSLGRLWLEGHPDDELRSKWKYYLDEAEQEPEAAAQLEKIRAERRSLAPEDIKVIDPCMGSGHILVYAFDVLMQIYEKAGWERREAVRSIVENNLYGLDIDYRAFQLAYFSVMMKARQYDRRFLTRGVEPQVYYPGGDIDLQEFGSLLTVENWYEESDKEQYGLLSFTASNNYRRLLAQKYDVVVTNPPYMGGAGMNEKLAEFVKENFPNSKSDLFSCFMERADSLVKQNGFTSLITMESWMFLSSFEKLREKVNRTRTIINMVHMPYLGKGGTSLGINFGTAAVIMQKGCIKDYSAQYEYTVYYECDKDGVPLAFPTKNERWKTAKQDNFSKIPGAPVAYWVSEAVALTFINGTPLNDLADPKRGMCTCGNDLFYRYWYEIPYLDFCVPSQTKDHNGWIALNKGGEYRKWYGNLFEVVDWKNNAKRLREFPTAQIKNEDFYFLPAITWSAITSGKLSFRLTGDGFIFDQASNGVFPPKGHYFYYIGLLNSKIIGRILNAINPTYNILVGDIAKIPIIFLPEHLNFLNNIVEELIDLSKTDWDSFETSWDFKKHPLV